MNIIEDILNSDIKRNNNCFVTIWFTGLSASGKSTLSERLFLKLKDDGISNIVLLDGESVREKLEHYKYDTNDRNEIGIMKSNLALDYIKKENHVIITGIAHHRETRDKIRKMFPHYYEIYLKCDADVCASRDYKGNYKQAINGKYNNFVGITEQYQESNPELVIETGNKTIEECLSIIIINVKEYFNKINHKK